MTQPVRSPAVRVCKIGDHDAGQRLSWFGMPLYSMAGSTIKVEYKLISGPLLGGPDLPLKHPRAPLTHVCRSWASLLVDVIIVPLGSHHIIAWTLHTEFAGRTSQCHASLVMRFPEAIILCDIQSYDQAVTNNSIGFSFPILFLFFLTSILPY